MVRAVSGFEEELDVLAVLSTCNLGVCMFSTTFWCIGVVEAKF
jgi:hypothetical protein